MCEIVHQPDTTLYISQPPMPLCQCTYYINPVRMVWALTTEPTQLVLSGFQIGMCEAVHQPDTTMYISQPPLHICQCAYSNSVLRVWALITAPTQLMLVGMCKIVHQPDNTLYSSQTSLHVCQCTYILPPRVYGVGSDPSIKPASAGVLQHWHG